MITMLTREEAIDRHAQLGAQEQEAARRLNHARLRLKAALAAERRTRQAALDRLDGLEAEAKEMAEAGKQELAGRATQDLVKIRLSELLGLAPVWQLARSELFDELRAAINATPETAFSTYDPEAVAAAKGDVQAAEQAAQEIRDELRALKPQVRP